ncbi:MAG: Cof-type HAD-IIB family hydrolase [Eubacteriales bacterium]|nr:Cof-type HAD-IIB family hydrolase [Eubacteriales bacterium]
MNGLKLIIVDLDNTLLRHDKSISDYTRSIIQRAKSLAIKIAFASARGPSAQALIDEGIFDAYCLYNGAIIFADGRRIKENLISAEIYRPVLEKFDARGLRVGIEIDAHHFVNFDIRQTWPNIQNFTRGNFNQLKTASAEKIYVLSRDPKELNFIRENLAIGLHCDISRDGMAMIMSENANKGKALRTLAAYYDIDLSEVAAFGDDSNDLEMLRIAGCGIAMKNAIPELKKVADEICSSNDEDGVAKWIHQRLL